MNTALEIIEAPPDSVQRVVGWLMLAFLSLGLGFVIWVAGRALSYGGRINSGSALLVIFCGAMLLGWLGLAIVAVRMALETRKWIVGRDYFERRSDILGFSWSKIQRATGWRLEIFFRDGHTSYLLNPIGARQTRLVPFYRTADVRLALYLGHQLANITGWPLHLGPELERLEKEL